MQLAKCVCYLLVISGIERNGRSFGISTQVFRSDVMVLGLAGLVGVFCLRSFYEIVDIWRTFASFDVLPRLALVREPKEVDVRQRIRGVGVEVALAALVAQGVALQVASKVGIVVAVPVVV